MSFVANDLEDTCRRIALNLKGHSAEPIPATFIGREIALTLDHMHEVRVRLKGLQARLVERQLSINTEIMSLKSRPSLINNWLEQTRLKNAFGHMLERAEWHTQRLTAESESRLQQLRSRLLELWNLYDQLSLAHGNTQNPPEA